MKTVCCTLSALNRMWWHFGQVSMFVHVLPYLPCLVSLSVYRKQDWSPFVILWCIALLPISSTNGIAIIVGVFCIVASVVAPHPVVPLLNMQFAGISSIQSVRYIAPSGAVIFWFPVIFVASEISCIPVSVKVILLVVILRIENLIWN